MELEPRPEQPPGAPVTDDQRQAAADRLVAAAGTARLTLSEFSERVGAVWAADSAQQLAAATEGIELPPPVGTTKTVTRVVSVLGDQNRTGRWRLPGRLTGWAVMGDVLVYSDSTIPLRRKGWRRWLGAGHPEPHGKEISG